MDVNPKDRTPPYGRFLVRLTRPFPNFDFSFIKPVRQRAVELLRLKPGDRVLDIGCGPGGSFPFLVRAVGPTGQVVGVEISPVHSDLARRRIASNAWKNVEVVESAAQNVSLTGTFAGLLMFAAPDVYASEEALENIMPSLEENSRVVAFGAKISNRRMSWLLNPFLKLLCNLSFSTTPRPDREPWLKLAKWIEHPEVKEYFFGLMFLVSGTVVERRG